MNQHLLNVIRRCFQMLLLAALLTASSKLQAQINQTPVVAKKPVQSVIDSLINTAWKTGRTNTLKSLENLKQIEILNEQNKLTYKQDIVKYYYGVFYKNINRFDESEQHFLEYEAYHEAKNNKANVAAVNQVKSNLYSDMGNYAKGMEAATKAQKLYQELNDTLGVVLTGNKMGFLLLEAGRIEEATPYFRKSIRLSRLKRDPLQEGDGYQNLGISYSRVKQYDSALAAYKTAYDIGEKLDDDYNKAINRYNMANILVKLKRYNEAWPFIQASLHLADSMQIPTMVASCKQVIAELQIATGQHKEAINALETMAVGEGQKLGLKDKMAMYGLLVEGHQAAGNMEAALDNLRIYKRLSDTLLNADTRKRINELEIQYQTEKKKQQIALLQTENDLKALKLLREAEIIEALQTENELKAETIAQQTILNLALNREKLLADSNLTKQELINLAMLRESLLKQRELEQEQEITKLLSSENELKEKNLRASQRSQQQLGGGLIGFAILGSLIFWLYQQQKSKNKIIARQSDDLQVLNREIHHRVKNNLQVVSSMLNLQAETIPDEATAAMFQEGSKRVQSMAFIHQNLYRGDSVNSVNMTEYVQMLVEHLFDAYNITPDKVKLQTEIEPMKLHTDTVIPIGMILNELISNALKYAFKGKENGLLFVSLKRENNLLVLKVKDNGVGMQTAPDIAELQSFGFKIVRAFTRKLKGVLNIDTQLGTDIELLIHKYKIA